VPTRPASATITPVNTRLVVLTGILLGGQSAEQGEGITKPPPGEHPRTQNAGDDDLQTL
jgi:hypothetical protein